MPAIDPTPVLILGGTEEAAALAGRLVEHPGLKVVTSLAGRTRHPAPVPGELRTGGFGGVQGLVQALRQERTRLLIDATHPYAATITENAAQACRATGVPRLRLIRPPWTRQTADTWIEVPDVAGAVAAVRAQGPRVFLSIGRQELAAFAPFTDRWFLVRLIERPETPLPLSRATLVLGRGPFDLSAELRLLREHAVDVVVSKNSGGRATYGKIAAARERGLPVVMITRPAEPTGERVEDVDQAAAWIEAQLRANQPS